MRRFTLSLCAALVLASCGGERARTQVMLIVDADADVRATAPEVTVEIAGRAAGGAFETVLTRSFDAQATRWPIEVAIIPRDGDASREWRAHVVAHAAAGAPRVEARAVGGFIAEQTRGYTLRREGACLGAAACGAEQTCRGGDCESALVPDTELRPYEPAAPSDGGPADAAPPDAAPPDAAPPDGGGGDAGPADAGPPDAGSSCLPATARVDLLLVIDNSSSMAEEQASLAVELPYLVRALTTGDLDGDSLPDFAPATDLQIGVVTTDMGSGGFMVPTCSSPMHGDDGVLRMRGNDAVSGCASSYPPVFSFGAGDNPDTFGFEVACVARVGTGGCGFEQPLEAMLKAIAPAAPTSWTAPGYEPIEFFGGTAGHGDGTNSTLFRDDSVLAVLVLTDEEDCSWTDPELLSPTSTAYPEDYNLRCFHHPEVQHPVARYVQGLRQMREDSRRLVFAAIAGIPVEIDPGDAAASYATILAHPDMTEVLDPDNPNRLRFSCNVASRGVAFPPRRIVQVAQGLSAVPGAGHTVHSICRADYRAAAPRIARLIGARVQGTCP